MTLYHKNEKVGRQSAHLSQSQQGRQLFSLEPTSQTEADYQKYSISPGSEFGKLEEQKWCLQAAH